MINSVTSAYSAYFSDLTQSTAPRVPGQKPPQPHEIQDTVTLKSQIQFPKINGH